MAKIGMTTPLVEHGRGRDDPDSLEYDQGRAFASFCRFEDRIL